MSEIRVPSWQERYHHLMQQYRDSSRAYHEAEAYIEGQRDALRAVAERYDELGMVRVDELGQEITAALGDGK